MPSFDLENNFDGPTAGLDEVGCGPWAGPVVAGAFIFLTQDIDPKILSKIKDSKQMTEKGRQALWDIFHQHQGTFWDFATASSSVAEIDTLNIRQAALLAMARAFEDLRRRHRISYALADGTGSPALDVPVTPVIKGDNASYSIAAASIIAKVDRDNFMAQLDLEYPAYAWKKNAGYGTKAHQEALAAHGITPWHRKSFKPIAEIINTQKCEAICVL